MPERAAVGILASPIEIHDIMRLCIASLTPSLHGYLKCDWTVALAQRFSKHRSRGVHFAILLHRTYTKLVGRRARENDLVSTALLECARRVKHYAQRRRFMHTLHRADCNWNHHESAGLKLYMEVPMFPSKYVTCTAQGMMTESGMLKITGRFKELPLTAA